MTLSLPYRIKRVYEPFHPNDGTRVLVDRLWPRGVSKARAHIDLWLKDIAPSSALREWFGHDPARWNEFRRRYREELRDQAAAVARMEDLAALGRVTLVYAAHDSTHNQAVVLADYLGQHLGASHVSPAA